MSHFLRKLYKQKPKQWGSIASVRMAVAENAERIYGIDYETIKAAYPYWEQAGSIAHDYAPLGADGGLVNGATLTHQGLLTNADMAACMAIHTDKINLIEGSVFTKVQIQNNSPAYHYFWSTDSFRTFSFCVGDVNRWFVGGHEILINELNYLKERGSPFNICAVYHDHATNRKVYVDGILKIDGIATAAADRPDAPIFVGGRSASANRYVDGITYAWYYFNKSLNENQQGRLNDNPYGLFAPIINRTYFVPSGTAINGTCLETLNISDFCLSDLFMLGQCTENFNISETINTDIKFSAMASENLKLNAETSLGTFLSCIIIENLKLHDEPTSSVKIVAEILESFLISDGVRTGTILLGTIIEEIKLNDSLNNKIKIKVRVSENLLIDDAIKVIQTLQCTIHENFGLEDISMEASLMINGLLTIEINFATPQITIRKG